MVSGKCKHSSYLTCETSVILLYYKASDAGLRELLKRCELNIGDQSLPCGVADVREMLIDCMLSARGITQLPGATSRLQFLQSFQVDLLGGVQVPTVDPSNCGTTSASNSGTSVMVYATSKYGRRNNYYSGDGLVRSRYDFIEFGDNSTKLRQVGQLRTLLRLIPRNTSDSNRYIVALLHPFQPHCATAGITALDGSPVHPGWGMHCALWAPTLALKAVHVNSRSTPLLHLLAAFQDHDYEKGDVIEIRPGHLVS